MKKNNVIPAVMAAVITVSLTLTACGGEAAGNTASGSVSGGASGALPGEESPAEKEGDEETAVSDSGMNEGSPGQKSGAEIAEAVSAEGKVLNIYVWNEEFAGLVAEHYPGYEKIDDLNGRIGDVEVHFIQTPAEDNAYQNRLDEKLLFQENEAEDDRIDLFLTDAGTAQKYVETDFVLPLSELGIDPGAELSDQYPYTREVVTDSNGNLKGSSWQSCPGLLIYNREIAREVLGTDDPDEVQKAVADWDTFSETAAKMKEAGYDMTSSVFDTYRVFANNVTGKWVEDGRINIDANIKKWVDISKEMADAEETGIFAIGDSDWSRGFYPEGGVFCYFGPQWFIDTSMAVDTEGSVANGGGWGAVSGPQDFYWGGSWICAAKDTDNPTLCRNLILTMTADEDVLTGIITDNHEFVNNTKVVEKLADDENFGDPVLGGQNALGRYSAAALNTDVSNRSMYDQVCSEEFQNAMKNYFEGSATYEEALELFYAAVQEKYPDLTYEPSNS